MPKTVVQTMVSPAQMANTIPTSSSFITNDMKYVQTINAHTVGLFTLNPWDIFTNNCPVTPNTIPKPKKHKPWICPPSFIF